MKAAAVLLAVTLAGAALVGGSYRLADARRHAGAQAPPAAGVPASPAAPAAPQPPPQPPFPAGTRFGNWMVERNGYYYVMGYSAMSYAGPRLAPGWDGVPGASGPRGETLWGPYPSWEEANADAQRCNADKTGATKPNPP